MAKKQLPSVVLNFGRVICEHRFDEFAVCGERRLVYGIAKLETSIRKWRRPPLPLCEACFNPNSESVLMQKIFPGLEIAKAHQPPRGVQ
jgi:hypothetical protein